MSALVRECLADGCALPAKTRGYCGKHAERIRRHGGPMHTEVIVGNPVRRFWTKVEKGSTPDACWSWRGTVLGRGYGQFPVGRKGWLAHRFAYELLVGPIPEGLQLDHLCRNTICVNPQHLEPVTGRVNTLRGVGVTARLAAAATCKHGHPWTPENTAPRPHKYGVARSCRTCRRQWQKAWRALRAAS